jgi:uncharacterized protein YjbI with pentapeptide repeats
MADRNVLLLSAALALAVFLTIDVTHAFRQEDMDKLASSNQCPRCDLSNASFWGVRLVSVDLSGANLSRANLGRSDLTNANLKGANLSGANLEYANLSGATWVDGKICEDGSIGKCSTR